MNKGQLIEAIASDADISKTEATRALDSFINNTTSTLSNGDNVALVGFGTFSTNQRSARAGRNPRTGQSIQIPAKTVVKFKPGSGLSNSVNS